jgi:hypothetical protein
MKIKKRKFNARIVEAYRKGEQQGYYKRRELHEAAQKRLSDRIYELEHTPEIKADTEAAFSRGVSHGKLLARTTIITALTQMDTGGTSPLPVPEIKPKLDPLPKPPSTRASESSGYVAREGGGWHAPEAAE